MIFSTHKFLQLFLLRTFANLRKSERTGAESIAIVAAASDVNNDHKLKQILDLKKKYSLLVI